MSEQEKREVEQPCDRCDDAAALAAVSIGANYEGSMSSDHRLCEGCLRELGEWFRNAGETLVTDGGERVEADVDRPDAPDYIPERGLACEAEDAVGWMHIGVDPSCDPVGDYWVPVDDPGLVERDACPRDEVKQFPLEAREPEYGSGKPAPDHVRNWTFTEGDDA